MEKHTRERTGGRALGYLESPEVINFHEYIVE